MVRMQIMMDLETVLTHEIIYMATLIRVIALLIQMVMVGRILQILTVITMRYTI